MTGKKEYPNGFASVASFIAADNDNTVTIYRRFDRLAARNLLHLQGRLHKLEAIQDALDDEVLRDGNIDSARAASSWEEFEELSKTNEHIKKRMDLAGEIENAIEIYRKHSVLDGLIRENSQT